MPVEVDPPAKISWDVRDDWADVLDHFVEAGTQYVQLGLPDCTQQSYRFNALFGTATGLGMGIFTFDWSMIAFFGSPLVTPVSCLLNLRCSS